MKREYFKAEFINTDDPDDIEKFSLASTVSGDLVAIEIAPNGYVIHNALTQDELEYLNNFCRRATQEDWERHYKEMGEKHKQADERNKYTEENDQNYWYDKSMMLEDLDFCDRLMERIQPFFGPGYTLPRITEVHRQQVGEGMDEHADMGHRKDLLRSMLFYLNDDYEGGELYFPALNFEYKPKAGDFVTFPSYERYTHGVRPVLSGSDRYVLAGFAWQAGKPMI